MAAEWELKYKSDEVRLEKLAADATIRSLVRDTAELRMESTYFDTPDGALSAKKQTLRLRRENDRSVVTFKTAGEGNLRGEWEYEAETIDGAAEKLISLGAPIAQQNSFLPICGASFTRTARTLVFGDGTEAELALDSGELYGGASRMPLCEAELELKKGKADTVLAFAALLEAKYHLESEPESKAQRAFRLAEK